ncbi:MAG: hypothetical protein IBX63_02055 [Coriobacteriia bacterium]|nr:hypothetical protein [Coriobacteriia bacterium]
MLESDTGQCQPLKYLKKNRETAPTMLARIRDVDRNGPPPNQELFRWLDAHKPERGFVIARIEDKTESGQQFNQIMNSVKMLIDRFVEGGEPYE